MKKLLLVLAILFSVVPAIAQFDTLVLVNGSRKAVILKEVGEKDIKYKLPADSLGPTYLIKKKLVEKLILHSGCVDLKDKGYENCEKDPTFGVIQGKDFKRTIISTDIAQIFCIQHFAIGIEHILKSRKLGIEAYYNMGLTDRKYRTEYERWEMKRNVVRGDATSGNYYKFSYYGLNFKVYPFSHKKATYWLAVGGEYGKASSFITNKSYIVSQYGGMLGEKVVTTYYETAYYNYHFNNGFNLRPTKHFMLQPELDLGINLFKNPQSEKFDLSFKYGFGLKAGFAF